MMLFRTLLTSAALFGFSLATDQLQKRVTVDDTFLNVNEGDQHDIYTMNVTGVGTSWQVQMSTGSADFVLDTEGIDLSEATDSGLNATITYRDGTVATGRIMTGNFSLGIYNVQAAFLSAPGTNATKNGARGIWGTGAPAASIIAQTIAENNSTTNGNPFTYTFYEDFLADTISFVTFLLSRIKTGTERGGVFTIGDVPYNLATVRNSTQYTVMNASDVLAATDGWTLALDGITVNGEFVNGGASFTGSTGGNLTEGQTLALLDVGTSLGVAPPKYVDAMYSKLPGAVLDYDTGKYEVDCDAMVNISFVFGNQTFPMHPIDATYIDYVNDDGKPICKGAFGYNNPTLDGADWILGDSYLRNVYTLFDSGLWASAYNITVYIQMLSLTDPDQAWIDFYVMSQSRLNSALNSTASVGLITGTAIATATPTA